MKINPQPLYNMRMFLNLNPTVSDNPPLPVPQLNDDIATIENSPVPDQQSNSNIASATLPQAPEHQPSSPGHLPLMLLHV